MLTNEYHIKDHLGNVTGDIVQDNSYYPFGMQIESLTYDPEPDNNNSYLYNGKEFDTDFDIDWYDYGARFYDAQIGRWHAVDPLAEEFPYESPYLYAGNNPIFYIDVSGAYKWPTGDKGKTQKKNYGKIYNYLKNNAYNDIKNNPVLLSKLQEHSGMTEKQILDAAKWDSGPTVELVDKPGEGVFRFRNAAGKYNNEVRENTIEINSDFGNWLQDANDSETAQAALFLFFSTLMHETNHYGDRLVNNGEAVTGESGAYSITNLFINYSSYLSEISEGESVYEPLMLIDAYDNEGYFYQYFNKEQSLNAAKNIIELKKTNENDQKFVPTLPE